MRRAEPRPLELPATATRRLKAPLVVVLGSPREVAEQVDPATIGEVVCYQMDLYQANRLREELAERGRTARVVVEPDLWNLPAEFASALILSPPGGERALKIDMVEQVFHVLRPQGTLVVVSPANRDEFYPGLLKKVFGRARADTTGEGSVFWCAREGERPRRRHEVTFHARISEERSLNFVSRPGVFSYGEFDQGARALTEVMEVQPGERVVDLGCGCGTNGIVAGLRVGEKGHISFVDSNVRALALADINARACGLTAFDTFATADVTGPAPKSYDVVLANPPYYAHGSIAQLFVDRGRELLRPGGRLYLVTRLADQVGPMMAELMGRTDAIERRGYVVLRANAKR